MPIRTKCLDCRGIDCQCGGILFHGDVAVWTDGGGETLEFLHFIYKDIQSLKVKEKEKLRQNGVKYAYLFWTKAGNTLDVQIQFIDTLNWQI